MIEYYFHENILKWSHNFEFDLLDVDSMVSYCSTGMEHRCNIDRTKK